MHPKWLDFYSVEVPSVIYTTKNEVDHISRSEQAPRSGFHPPDKSDNSVAGFLGPRWYNKKVDPGRYVSCGSYELVVSNIAPQIKKQ